MKTHEPKITKAEAGPNRYIVTATGAIPGDIFFCLTCGQQLRVHKQHQPSGPRDHFEHVIKQSCPAI